MSGRSPSEQSATPLPPLLSLKWLTDAKRQKEVLREYLKGEFIDVAAEKLVTDSHSLGAMRTALWAAMYDDRTRDILAPIMPTLMELEYALAMLAEDKVHAAFKVEKNPHGGRGYTAVQRCFLEMCFVASEILVAICPGRKNADDQVRQWGAATAERLGVSLKGKKSLRDKRTELGWHARWPDHYMRMIVNYARKEGRLEWWLDTYQNFIEEFDERSAY